ncbi:MAG: fibronectin type III domain-containing protein [Bacteroidetes bacterium]|nr:fibronectin type III domain-containing protein [Bacteroidota bacterium]
MKKTIWACLTACLVLNLAIAQSPTPALVGYFHNWNDGAAPYIQLNQIDSRYNVIEVAFAEPEFGTDYKMVFSPAQTSQANFISQIQTLKSQNKKVLISIGGANATVSLDNIAERDTFVARMTGIVNTYGFDGIDIDLEGSSVLVSGGTIANPTDAKIINLINAIKQIMINYRAQYGKKLFLTMAPETAFIQGGMSAYGSIWGAYLPIVHALRDSIDILQVQLYNSGTMYGIDGNIYTQGTADFIAAMAEAVIVGFNTQGGYFAGLPASKVAIALPACPQAAGGGFTPTSTVAAAINYLKGTGPKPGSYTRSNPNGYQDLRGLMTWSINWDAVNTCNNSSYEFATNYQSLFNAAPSCTTAVVPTGLTVSSVGASTVSLAWQTTNADSYKIRYKPVNATVWTTVVVNATSHGLTNLYACTPYQVRVASVCNGVTSAYSNAVNFQTVGCVTACNIPTSWTGLSTTVSSITVSWKGTGAGGYNVQYRPTGTTTWTTKYSAAKTYTINGLTGCTDYDIRVRSQCSYTSSSAYSSIIVVSTAGCPQQDDPNKTAFSITEKIESEMQIYPNPANEFIVVKRSDEGSENFTILNAHGKLCIAGRLTNNETQVPIEKLQPGLFILITEKSSVKFIKH